MTPFRWKNCHADIAASPHDLTIRLFLDDVILPSIRSLESRIDELGRSAEPVARFEQSDLEDVLAETRLAFGLAVQSIWERQIRAYLLGCAQALCPAEPLEAKLAKADWDDIRKLFRRLRGIAIEAFPSFGELDTLHHLGNACRHGDGKSARELARRCPEWWPVHTPLPPEFGSSEPLPMTVARMNIPTDRIEGFVSAIARFWQDQTYIYNESIERKHLSLERQLVRDRAERDWCPTMEEHGS